jgi:ABC-type transport system involved in cytochrome c biogenesis permease subunit
MQWADIAWGRRWGFDPKETWTVILLFVMTSVALALTFVQPSRWWSLALCSVQIPVAILVLLFSRLSELHHYDLLWR